MADYYEQFSVGLDFPEKAAKDFMRAVDAIAESDSASVPAFALKALGYSGDGTDFGDWLDENEVYGFGDLRTEYSHDRLFIWNDSSGVNQEPMAKILSAVMKEHHIEKPAIIPVSYWCNKPRTDGFGGGVWVIGPEKIDYADTRSIGERMASEMMAEKKADRPKTPRM